MSFSKDGELLSDVHLVKLILPFNLYCDFNLRLPWRSYLPEKIAHSNQENLAMLCLELINNLHMLDNIPFRVKRNRSYTFLDCIFFTKLRVLNRREKKLPFINSVDIFSRSTTNNFCTGKLNQCHVKFINICWHNTQVTN